MSDKRWEKPRWRIVHLLDKLPGQCWTDLVTWAIDGPKSLRQRGERAWPWRPQTSTCRRDAADVGACYCNKLQREPGGSDAA